MTLFENNFLHFGSLILAIACVLLAIRLMRKYKKDYARFKKVKIGDPVKFYTYCDDYDCIMDGKVTGIKGPIVEIDVDEELRTCTTCLNGMKIVNKHYKEVIF